MKIYKNNTHIGTLTIKNSGSYTYETNKLEYLSEDDMMGFITPPPLDPEFPIVVNSEDINPGWLCISVEEGFDSYEWTYDTNLFEKVTESSEFGIKYGGNLPEKYLQENVLYLHPKNCEIVYFNDYYLPDVTQLQLIRTNLYLTGIGEFEDGDYWSSSEDSGTDETYYINFLNDTTNLTNDRTLQKYVRPVRNFTSTEIYALGDLAEGGYIFNITNLGGGSFEYEVCAEKIYEVTRMWGLSGVVTGAILTGAENTEIIYDLLLDSGILVNRAVITCVNLNTENDRICTKVEDLIGTKVEVTKEKCKKSYTITEEDLPVECSPVKLYYDIQVIKDDSNNNVGLLVLINLEYYTLDDIVLPAFSQVDMKIVGTTLLYNYTTNVRNDTFRNIKIRVHDNELTGGVLFNYPEHGIFESTIEVTLKNECVKKFYIKYPIS